jgi:hypothetical protein
VIGAVLFTATYLLEGLTRPSYDAWRQPISALSLGPGGWVQQINFVVFGLLLVLSAIGWYQTVMPGRGAIWFPVFQGLAGFCLIGAGVFSMDPFPGYPPATGPIPSTLHGTLHSIFAWVLILCLAQSCFALAALFWQVRHEREWSLYSYATGVLILVFWGFFVRYPSGPIPGLVERLSAESHALWLCAVTVWVLTRERRRD